MLDIGSCGELGGRPSPGDAAAFDDVVAIRDLDQRLNVLVDYQDRLAGQSILVIDKNVEALIEIADRHYVIERGRVTWTGTSPELAAAPDVQHRYLGI